MCYFCGKKTKLLFFFSSIDRLIGYRRVLATMEIKDASFTNVPDDGLDINYMHMNQLINCWVFLLLVSYIGE